MFLARVGKVCKDVWRVFDTVFTNFESDFAMVWQCFWHGLAKFVKMFGEFLIQFLQTLKVILPWFGNVFGTG